jgi:hypothetical protein
MYGTSSNEAACITGSKGSRIQGAKRKTFYQKTGFLDDLQEVERLLIALIQSGKNRKIT